MAGLFKKETISNEEPRIGSFQVQTSTFGAPVQIAFGTPKITGNIIDYIDFTAIAHTTTESQGGKGGGVEQQNTTWTYTVAVLIGIAEGVCGGIGKVWADKNITTLSAKGLTLFAGNPGQAPWSYMQTYHPERALGYSSLAYVAGVMDLGGSASLPNLAYEFFGFHRYGGGIVDANPKEIISTLLSSSRFGCAWDAEYIGDLDPYSVYVQAESLFLTVPITEQKTAIEYIRDILECTNSKPLWSEGKFKIVCLGDEAVAGNGVTYTPNLTPLYDITDDDLLPVGEDDDPIIATRDTSIDAFNVQEIEFIDRENDYNVDVADYKEQGDIDVFGRKAASAVKMHYIHNRAMATKIARFKVLRYLYVRNTYKFRLGWKFSLLEPGDLLRLPESEDSTIVRITKIEEDKEGTLTFTAEECPGVFGATAYPTQSAQRTVVDYNVDPGDVLNPVIFEMPAVLSDRSLKAYVAAAGESKNWGGCGVWVSTDSNTYKKAGVITNPARYGSLVSELAAPTSNPDILNTLAIDVSDSKAVLLSGTQDDADNKRTLCWVDGELIAYQTANLVDTNRYNLSYLVRGCYSTPIGAHPAGSKFARIDEGAIVGYPYSAEDIGKTIYIKLTSFNIYGFHERTLDEVTAIEHVISNFQPPDVAVLMVEQLANGRRRFVWDYNYPSPNDVIGFRLKYHVGASFTWDDAIVLYDGYVPQSPFETDSMKSGVYTVLIKAVDSAGNESSNAAYAILGVGEELVENVLLETDCKDAGFTGTKTNCSIVDGDLVADSDGVGGYLKLAYEEPFTVEEACQLMIQADTAGDVIISILCEYPDGMYPADESPMYPADPDAPMYRRNTLWSRYTSKVNVAENYYRIRLEIAAGPIQGKIRALKIIQDVPDVSESFDNLAISASGTRVPITKKFRKILRVYAPVQGVGGAVGWRCGDKDNVLGPMLYLVNGAGTPVDDIADVTVQGC